MNIDQWQLLLAQGSGLGLRLLRKVTLFGHDLSLHMEGGSEVETLEKLKSNGLQAACHLSGEHLRALQQLMAGCNKATVCDFDLPEAAGCSCFEFASFFIRIRLHMANDTLLLQGIAMVYLNALTADHYIVRRSTSKDYYDFMDPRLVALQVGHLLHGLLSSRLSDLFAQPHQLVCWQLKF